MRTGSDLYPAELPTNGAKLHDPTGSRRPRRLRRTGVLSVSLLTLLAFVGCEKKEEKPKASPPDVLVADVVQQNVPIVNEWVAQLNGPVNAEITPKVQGYLLKQNYQNGYFVKKGQLLFELDPRQYQAAVEQAKAQVAVAQAKYCRGHHERCTATLPWPRRTPSRKSNSTPTLPTKPRPRRRFLPNRPPCKMPS